SPEGNSHLICRGSRNLAFPDDLSRPVPLEAGTARTVRFSLLACSALIPAGWRLRLAIAGVDFPIVFPPRGAFELGLDAPRSRLVLPVVPPRPESARLDIPESPPPPAASSVDLGSAATWEVKRVDRTTIFQRRATGAEHQPERGGLTYSSARAWSVSVEDDQPNSTRIRSDGSTTLERSGPERSGWSVRTDASLELTTDGQSFLVAIELEAFNDGAAVWRRRWEKSVPREWA
ncbi:MAG: CocE/NonD family hydrolase C-terminal non-catalytic domain-containing protein, partial [Acidimicrobiia bacterium]